jgi:hypothetical protein
MDRRPAISIKIARPAETGRSRRSSVDKKTRKFRIALD